MPQSHATTSEKVIQRQLDWLARSEEVVSADGGAEGGRGAGLGDGGGEGGGSGGGLGGVRTVDGVFMPEPPGPRPHWVQLWTHDRIPYYWDRDERKSQWEDPRGLETAPVGWITTLFLLITLNPSCRHAHGAAAGRVWLNSCGVEPCVERSAVQSVGVVHV